MSVRVAGHQKAIPAVVGAGTQVAVGTDSVIGPIGLVADELAAMVALGMTPAQVLVAGTVGGADLLGLADRGQVAPGLRADLLVVRGRPDQDITAIAKPVLVMRGGTVV
jgi:imidazolonepropionase-like amidohydrolase